MNIYLSMSLIESRFKYSFYVEPKTLNHSTEMGVVL